ncbi:MAG: RDD family protein [Candidatus Tectomicrobia bacterium]|nr:RDD family protein [Candidatus Tectomicrobia bacterium]
MDEAVTYAGFWVRVGATLIDALLIMLVTLPILVSVYGSGYFFSEEFVQGKVDFLLTWVFPAVAVITFWVLKSATPGKMAFSAVIVDAQTGGKLSVAQCVGRYFAYIPATLLLFLGLIWVGIDKRKQGWHDKLASTVVVRNKPTPVAFAKPENN